jgi:hypothetical protein
MGRRCFAAARRSLRFMLRTSNYARLCNGRRRPRKSQSHDRRLALMPSPGRHPWILKLYGKFLCLLAREATNFTPDVDLDRLRVAPRRSTVTRSISSTTRTFATQCADVAPFRFSADPRSRQLSDRERGIRVDFCAPRRHSVVRRGIGRHRWLASLRRSTRSAPTLTLPRPRGVRVGVLAQPVGVLPHCHGATKTPPGRQSGLIERTLLIF